jgi:hypothetical protein
MDSVSERYPADEKSVKEEKIAFCAARTIFSSSLESSQDRAKASLRRLSRSFSCHSSPQNLKVKA